MAGKKGPCWRGYKQIGMKEKNGREVPNCVPINENVDVLDQIFQKYNNRNIIMKWSDKDFDNLLNDLYNHFQDEDEVTEFMASGEIQPYLTKYNIDLVEPEEFYMDFDTTSIPGQTSDTQGKMGPAGVSEIRRMQQLAGILEEDKIKNETLNPGLVFKSEGFRNTAAKWLENPANYSKLAKESKMTKAPFSYKMKDSTGIEFPVAENKMEAERLKKILETLTRKMPNALGASVTEYKND